MIDQAHIYPAITQSISLSSIITEKIPLPYKIMSFNDVKR